MAARYDIAIEQGASFFLNAALQDKNGNPFDLTDWPILIGQIRKTVRSDIVICEFIVKSGSYDVNGDFTDADPALGLLGISIPAISTGGVDLETDGNFATDPGPWTKGVGWTIAGGKASHAPGLASNITQDCLPLVLQAFTVTWTISDMTVGSIHANVAGWANGPTHYHDGTYVDVIISSHPIPSATLYFMASYDFDGSISAVHIQAANQIGTALIPAGSSVSDPRSQYVYDIIVQSTPGLVKRVLQGNVYVSPSTTREVVIDPPLS